MPLARRVSLYAGRTSTMLAVGDGSTDICADLGFGAVLVVHKQAAGAG